MDCPGNQSQPSSSLISSSNLVISGGNFSQYNHTIQGSKGFDLFQEAIAPSAFHNSGERYNPPKCHPNTRTAVIRKIWNWILFQDSDTLNSIILWLKGAAGAGKSAIAQTIAEMGSTEGYLLASFFFSRTDSRRNHAQSLFATIAYQMAVNVPQTRTKLFSNIGMDPMVFKRSLRDQFASLVAEPWRDMMNSTLQQQFTPYLVVIDGLDECNERTRCQILDTIVAGVREHNLPLIFLIASRPEHDISCRFKSADMDIVHTCLTLDSSFFPDRDIEIFLRDQFAKIAAAHPFRRHIQTPWPTEDVIKGLVRKSSGQFIYASTVIKYVKSPNHRPDQQLEVVLNSRPARGALPFAELDALYMRILSSVDDIQTTLCIIACHLMASKIRRIPEVGEIELLLGLQEGDIEILFCGLSPIISIDPDYADELIFQHASFTDFLCDRSRAGRYYVYDSLIASQLFQKLIRYLASIDGVAKPSSRLPVCSRTAIYIVFDFFTKPRPTPLVKQDTLSLSISGLHEAFCIFPIVEETLWFIYTFIPAFFDNIRKERADNLYAHYLSSLDEFFAKHLKHYYDQTGLTFVVAFVDFFIHNQHIERRPELGYSCRVIDEDRLALLASELDSHKSLPFYQLLHDYLMDPKRSKGNTLNGAKYATAALCCLRNTYGNTWKLRDIYMTQTTALEIFIYFIRRADRSEELINLIQSLSPYASSNSTDQKLIAARQASRDYLQRVLPLRVH